jgi:hypothetical protein
MKTPARRMIERLITEDFDAVQPFKAGTNKNDLLNQLTVLMGRMGPEDLRKLENFIYIENTREWNLKGNTVAEILAQMHPWDLTHVLQRFLPDHPYHQ